MKNLVTSILFVLAFVAAHSGLAQTIRRCNNSGLTIAGVNIYTTLQAAHDAASAGDIIYLEPTGISYGGLNCTRQLTIVGNGYFLDQNPGLQLDTRESLTGFVSFGPGSAGSRITGCNISSTFSITANNIVAERNIINGQTYVGYNGQTGSYASVTNVIIRHNYQASGQIQLRTSGTTVTNVIISNNILLTGVSTSGAFTSISSTLISNNVLGNLAGTYTGVLLDVDNAVIKNNVLTYTGTNSIFTQRNNTTSYNISGNNQLGTASGNQQNIAPSAVFVGGTASTDGAFQLRTGSPAIGTGDNGTDIGAYGGTLPYRIAGIPNVPSIYQFNQTVSGNSLNATISTRSNN